MFSISTVIIFAQLKVRTHGLVPRHSTGNMHCPSKSRIYGSCMVSLYLKSGFAPGQVRTVPAM